MRPQASPKIATPQAHRSDAYPAGGGDKNKNLTAAITTIHPLLAGDGDLAVAVARALDGAGLLVDPEHTYGTVLRRTPQGWAPVAPTAQPAAAAPTELEQQASDWDAACVRAERLVDVVRATYAPEPDFVGVRADRDTAVISLQITELSRWAGWMSTLGIVEHQLTSLDYVVCGRTTIGDVPVSVLAYDLPEVQLVAQAGARRPYRHAGLIYDLALGQKDITGDVWFFHGDYSPEGMPLLSQDGRPERCTLAAIVDLVGPLFPVREPVTAAQGGERG